MALRFHDRETERIAQYLPHGGPHIRALRVVPGGLDDAEDFDDPTEWDDEPRGKRRRSVAVRVAFKGLAVLAAFLLLVSVYIVARDGSFVGALGLQTSEGALPGPRDPGPAGTASAGTTTAPADAAQAIPHPPLPDVPGLVVLIRNAIVALQHANDTGNYSVLLEIAAPAFQAVNSPGGLSSVFADLRTRKLDLDAVAIVNPNLHQPPVIDDDGMLRLVGFFEASAVPVDFDLVFQWMNPGWRLFGIALQPAAARPDAGKQGEANARVEPGAPQVPDGATLAMLIRSTVIALNQANLTGNYSVLRDLSAPAFQDGNSFADLATIFADLRGRQLDLAPVAVIDPRLFRPAVIDERKMLRLTGFFPSQPEQVNFDLAFQRVDGDWRLFGIGLNTSRTDPSLSSNVSPAVPSADPHDAPSVTPVADSSGVAPPIPRLRPTPKASE